MIQQGHEVAGHTLNHVDRHRTSSTDLDANDAAQRGLGAAPTHFAHAYGEVSPRAKQQLSACYASLCGIHKGLVHDGGDRNQLPGVGIEGADDELIAHARSAGCDIRTVGEVLSA